MPTVHLVQRRKRDRRFQLFRYYVCKTQFFRRRIYFIIAVTVHHKFMISPLVEFMALYLHRPSFVAVLESRSLHVDLRASTSTDSLLK